MPLVDSVQSVREMFQQLEVHTDALSDDNDQKIALYKWTARLATAFALREMEVADMLITHELKVIELNAQRGY